MSSNLKLKAGDIVVWKDEDSIEGEPVGPVWIFRGDERLNYRDSDQVSAISKKPYPAWLTRSDACQLAEQNGLEFRET